MESARNYKNNIVKHFKVGGRLDCVIVQASRSGEPEPFYYCFVGTYGKPSKFLTKLAFKVDHDRRTKKKTYVGEHEVFSWGEFTTVSDYTVNTLFTYLGWDTGKPGTLMSRMNQAKPPYRRLAVDLKRTALDFLALAKAYDNSLRALEFVENVNET